MNYLSKYIIIPLREVTNLVKNNYRSLKLLIIYMFTLIYLEFIFRIFTIGHVQLKDFLIIGLFSLSTGIILFIITDIFKNRIGFIISCLLIGLVTVAFVSQLVYYEIFNMFYIMYSAGNAAQVFEFWREALNAIVKNIFPILLMFLPLLTIIFARKKLFSKYRTPIRFKLVLASFIVIFHVLGVSTIYMDGKAPNTAYDVYYQTSFPLLSMEKLGLVTTMRLDVQRNLTGWTPYLSVDASAPEDVVEPTPEDKEEEIEEEIVIEYNTMDIDFDRLIAEEDSNELLEMHKYFKNAHSTKKNEYTGIYEGYNLILITAEGFSPYAIHQEATPTLYKMLHQGYNFTNFYTPIWGVSTSDGEYVANTGLIPKSGVWSFTESSNNSMPFAMGNQLQRLGYKTVAYHNHTYDYYNRDLSHPNMGYDYKGVGNGLNVTKVWPASDLEMMENSMDEYIDSQPFHAYYMTVSGHLEYTFMGNSMATKNKDVVKDLPYSERLKAYIATQVELDRAMEYLLQRLEEAGVAEKTLIAISADHYPYGLEKSEIDEIAGHTVESNFELYKNNFLLYVPGMEAETIDKPASSLDIIPTISNLLGIEYDSRLLMGRDIFSDSDPLVIFLNKSFITDKGFYNAKEGKFLANPGSEVDDEYINKMINYINAKFYYSAKILETDYFNKVIEGR